MNMNNNDSNHKKCIVDITKSNKGNVYLIAFMAYVNRELLS